MTTFNSSDFLFDRAAVVTAAVMQITAASSVSDLVKWAATYGGTAAAS